ncbi:MAG: hypothetical protein JST86_11605 [Bacteroidetes bacterium]|nr:hypothetical protein [Bacteroidota bacterium]
MKATRHFIWILLACAVQSATAQKDSLLREAAKVDSSLQSLQHIPVKYIKQADAKVGQYTKRITSKTEQTLTKLAKWEGKIKSLLEKASPETAQRLFGNNQLTFAAALEKYKKGEAIIADKRAQYDAYTDKLTTSLAYLDEQKENIDAKLVEPVKKAKEKADALQEQQAQTDAVVTFIKERRKLLVEQSIKYIGNSKYLEKITSENYYLVQTLKNYKELFHDAKKAEQTALQILQHIKGFNTFFQQNSMLSQLFGGGSGQGGGATLTGLQTRASVNNLIQSQIASAGPSAAAQIRQNMLDAQAQLNALKDKVMKAGGTSPDADLPAPKKYDATKTKTILQRIHLGSDISFVKDNNQMPTVANVALSANYQLSSKKEFSIGTAYKAGLGSINRIAFSNQGVGFRSSFSLQMKKSFWATGGWEANYNAGFKNIAALQNYDVWTQSAMMGVEKRLNIKTKLTKGTKFVLLYDALAHQAVPTRQPFVFRVGYNF